MAEGSIEVARAFITIVPSLKGSRQTISQELEVAGAEAGKSSGEKTGNSFLESCGTVLAAGAKALAAATLTATTALAAGVVAIGKAALQSYADYEQLAGGVETLFGAGGKSLQDYADSVGLSVDEASAAYDKLMAAQDAVMANAQEAYKTAGLSANEYMETVTSFSAALLQSLGGDTEEAAAVADMAIQDMADNANKMGTDMAAIQTAYQGFAKQNYTMLDNLKLGYGGTKTEMERLLADATKISGIEYDISNLDDVYKAIHVIQEEMGITGTTAEEAMFTISGSANATKAAWNNVLTAIAGGGDLESAIDDLVDSVFGGASGGGLLNNILPRVSTIVKGIGKFLTKAAPILSQYIPTVVSDVASMITESMPVLFDAFNSAFNTILVTLIGLLPTLLPVAVEGLVLIAGTILDNLPMLLETLLSLITQLVVYLSEADVVAQLTQGAVDIVLALANGLSMNLPLLLPALIDMVTEISTTLTSPENIKLIVNAALMLVGAIVMALVASLPEIGELFVQLALNLAGIITDFANWVAEGMAGWAAWWDSTVVPWFNNLTANASAWLSGIWTNISTWFNNLISGIVQWFTNIINNVVNTFNNIKNKVVSFFTNIYTNVVNSITNIKNTITNWFNNRISAVTTFVSKVWTTIANWFGQLPGKLSGAVQSTFNLVANWYNNFVTYGKNLVTGLWNGITDKVQWLYNKISGWVDDVLSYIKKKFGISSPSKVLKDEVGKFMAEGIGEGFIDEMANIETDMAKSIPTKFNTSVGFNSAPAGEVYTPGNNSVAYGGLTFNIYGAEGQDINELAEIIMDKIQHVTTQQGEVYA